MKTLLPSCWIALLAESMIPVQSRPSFHPKNGFSQPAGTDCRISSGDTFQMAMAPIENALKTRMENWATSVMTMLTMPPFTI